MRAKSTLLVSFFCCVSAFCIASKVAFGQTGPGGVGNSSGSGGQPANLLWLRGDAGTSTTTNNDPVSAWNDQSGNNNHATQSNAARQPLFIANAVNNRPAIRFDGSNDILALPNNSVGNSASARSSSSLGAFCQVKTTGTQSSPLRSFIRLREIIRLATALECGAMGLGRSIISL